MTSIIAYAASQDDLKFNRRLSYAFKDYFQFIIISPKISILLSARLLGLQCHLIKYDDNIINDSQQTTVEVMTNVLSLNDAKRFYSGIIETLKVIQQITSIHSILIWNGLSVQGRALSDFAIHNGIRRIYFELANIPGRLFADPEGVNAFSTLYRKPDQLDLLDPIDHREYELWRQQYILNKCNEITTPTAIASRRIQNWLFPLDVFGVKLFNIPSIGSMSIRKKLKEKWALKTKPVVDIFENRSGGYIFFPMQVENDSQILFHSEISIMEAVRLASTIAYKNGKRLVVKLHPTENTASIVTEIRSVVAPLSVTISEAPSMELVLHADHVVTINSTVGLEAMIAGIPVTFLGRSFYPYLTGDRLPKYVMRYLIEMEYFSDTPLSDKAASMLLQRMGVK